MNNTLKVDDKVRILDSAYLTAKKGSIGRVTEVIGTARDDDPLYLVDIGVLYPRVLTFYGNEIEEIVK